MSLLGGVVDLQVVGFVGCCDRLCICLIVWCWLECLLMCCICGLSGFAVWIAMAVRCLWWGWFSRLLLLVQIGRMVLVLIWCLCCLCLLGWVVVIIVVLWVG